MDPVTRAELHRRVERRLLRRVLVCETALKWIAETAEVSHPEVAARARAALVDEVGT